MGAEGQPPRDHFLRLVRQWSQLGPPLRPWPGDTAVVQRIASGLRPGTRAVVLGLTPETIGCDWPQGTRLLAVDHSLAMIGIVWPASRRPPGVLAVSGVWQALPVGSHSIDLVAGDGCHAQFSSLDAFEGVTREVRRTLRPGGLFVTRVLLRPDRAESRDDIARAMAAGEIGSVHALKLRLLAALHGTSGVGARLDDVWQAWKTLPPPGGAMAAGARGWSEGELQSMEGYRGLQTRYGLPTLAEFRSSLSPWFEEVECVFGTDELSERCPTFVLACGRD